MLKSSRILIICHQQGQRWPSDFAEALRRRSPSIGRLGKGKLLLRCTTPIYLNLADIAGILDVVFLLEFSPKSHTFERGKSGSVDLGDKPRATMTTFNKRIVPSHPRLPISGPTSGTSTSGSVDPGDKPLATTTIINEGIVSSYARSPITEPTSGTSTRRINVDVNIPEDTGVLIVELMESILGRNVRSRTLVAEEESSHKAQESRQYSDFIYALLRSAFLNGEFSAISELEGQNAAEALDIMYHVRCSMVNTSGDD